MEELIAELVAQEKTYRPGPEVGRQLRQVTLAPIIGPSAVGKSTCMDYVSRLDDRFGRVQSFTTRPPKVGESQKEYRFLPHNEQNLRSISDQVRRGQLVQYAIHPTLGHIYGSEPHDYQRPYMMLDTLSSAIPSIRRLPFGKIVELAMVTEPAEWDKRFWQRHPAKDDATKRIKEGVASLRWSLDQGPALPWIVTPEGMARIYQIAAEVRDTVLGSIEPALNNRRVGERLLAHLLQLLD